MQASTENTNQMWNAREKGMSGWTHPYPSSSGRSWTSCFSNRRSFSTKFVWLNDKALIISAYRCCFAWLEKDMKLRIQFSYFWMAKVHCPSPISLSTASSCPPTIRLRAFEPIQKIFLVISVSEHFWMFLWASPHITSHPSGLRRMLCVAAGVVLTYENVRTRKFHLLHKRYIMTNLT